MLLVCFLLADQKMVCCQTHALKSLISTNGMQYLSKEFFIGSVLPFLNESTNNLVVFINVGSIT